MKLLIPGGAGYIGSHMVRYAQEHGHEVVVLDDFSTGHEWSITDCEILPVNLLDQGKLSRLLKGRYFDGVIHFAAKSLVGESVKKPELYYRNNVVGTLNLVNEMLQNDVNNLVFSSTAAIFGNPEMFAGKKVGAVICGGNIDPRLLASILNRNMAVDGRIARLRIDISDEPGMLAAISTAIGKCGGNIVEIYHQRLFYDVPAKLAKIDAVIETRGPAHVDEIIAALRAANFQVRQLEDSAS